MISALNSYLLQHKSISIPGLGTIYVERIPAQSDFVNKQLLPPAYHYRFDKYSDVPDKDFFTYLAADQRIAEYEAINLYNEWAAKFRNKISSQESVRWTGVGTLTKDVSGDLIFEPFSPIGSYLQPIPAERIIRTNEEHTMIVGDRERTNVEMSGYLQEEAVEVHVEKESWWIYAVILAALALLAIFFHFYQNGFNISSSGNHQKVRIK